MTHLRLIINKNHDVQKHPLQLIDFIKRWSLCYDLSCVVKHLLCSTQADSKLHDLQLAEWHLCKKVIAEQQQLPKGTSSEPAFKDATFTGSFCRDHSPMIAEAAGKEWGLPRTLSKALFYITAFQNESPRFQYIRVFLLKQAHINLSHEVNKLDPFSSLTPDQ